MYMRARIFVCCWHDDIFAVPWNGGDLFDFHDNYTCTPGSHNCSCQLFCVARLAGDGVWMVADTELEQWTRIDNKAGVLYKQCAERYDVNLQWVQENLDRLKDQAIS